MSDNNNGVPIVVPHIPAEMVEAVGKVTVGGGDSGNDGYICDWPGCDRIFSTIAGVSMHRRRVHTGELRGSPAEIGARRIQPGELSVPGRSTCTLCGRMITDARMRSHLRRVHNATEPKRKQQQHGVECPECGNVFAHGESLRVHRARMHGVAAGQQVQPVQRTRVMPHTPISTTRVASSQISDEAWQERAAATVNRATAEYVRLTAERADYQLNLEQFTVDDDVVILRDVSGGLWMLRRIG